MSSRHSSRHPSQYLQVPLSQPPPRPPSSASRAHSSVTSARHRAPSLQSSDRTARRSTHRGSSVHAGSTHSSPMPRPHSRVPSSLAPSDSISSYGHGSSAMAAHGERHNADREMRHTPSYHAYGPPQPQMYGPPPSQAYESQHSYTNHLARAPSYAASSLVSAQSLPPPLQRQTPQPEVNIMTPGQLVVAHTHMQAPTPQRHQGVYVLATAQEETYTNRLINGDKQTFSRRMYTQAQYYPGSGKPFWTQFE